MIKQEEVNKAYDEFRNYWDGLGFPEASDRYVRLAFNEGYKAAKQSKLVVVKPIETETSKVDLNENDYKHGISSELSKLAPEAQNRIDDHKQLTMKSSSKKHYPNGRNKRSSKVVADDSYEVSKYLRGLNAYVQLSLIVMHMNKIGRKHWNTNNASAFMRLMIKDKYPVVKVSHGLYQYKKVDK